MIDYTDSENYINRELSWLDFNMRVLSEAKDKENPLFERLKFFAITGSNLDEFFMVRVASLKNMEISDYKKKDASGLTPTEQLSAISEKTHKMVEEQYNTYSKMLVPRLVMENICILNRNNLSAEQENFVERYFKNEIYPVLTPMAVDSSRPFPLIQNKVLNICALIKKENKEQAFATVQIPSIFKHIIKLPSSDNKRQYILLEEIVQKFLSMLFMGHDVICSYPYRVMRDANIPIDEDDSEDLLLEIEKSLKERERSGVIRLEVDCNIKKELLSILKKKLKVKNDDIYKINGPIDLTFLNKLYGEDGFSKYKYEPFKPQVRPELRNVDLFEKIREGDILLHHPYDSFSTIVDLIKQASVDENVLAIKQTLYRVSGNSPIIEALSRAAENGKQVSVLVELKARFDEENNIIWARKLEKAGCHVIYGLLGLKTHSKITEIVRREEDGIRRYVHLGTGNYNDITANFYTDMGLLTCSKLVGDDAGAFFNMISGFSEPSHWNKLILAPIWLRKKTEEMIEREIKHSEEGRKARIIAKVNSLVDPDIIALLYKASQSGVRIDLIVRGICALRAGVEGLSENITVRSIVGRYLEHTRIYYFYNDGQENVFCASADWMQRNLNRRVEIMFPIDDENLKKEVINVLDIQLADTMRAHIQTDGVYIKDRRGRKRLDCQEYCMNEALERSKTKDEKKPERVFIPKMKPEEE
ncbi:MAG: RNA degradosome polyphosphate kinase [Oscillospiraceae bacterium]|nr:RNA degradosome polyphosphate kinase [Oscillospiraceae bacterium]